MARFSGTDAHSLIIRAPKEHVVAIMTEPARIIESLGNVDATEHVDDRTIRIVQNEVHEKGVRFKGDRTVRYDYDGADLLTWNTVSNGNMMASGQARFIAEDETRTRVEFRETIECEMQVNRLLGRVLKPIVERHIARGVGEYLERVRARLESAA